VGSILDNSILGLATIRQNRGISLEQIADSTKISVRSLKAIELGAFEKLPGGVYNTSYIRQYAKAIDFDEVELLAYYSTWSGSGSAAEVDTNARKDRGVFGSLRTASILR